MIARVIIWALRRRRWHDPREARPEGSQFRDQKSRGFVEKLSRAQCRGGSSVLGRDMFIVNDCPLSGQAPEERHEQASFSCRSYGARSQPPGGRVYKRVALHGAFLVDTRLFNKAKSCLHLREFAKNSRIFAAFAPGANRAPQLFSPRKSVVQNLSGT